MVPISNLKPFEMFSPYHPIVDIIPVEILGFIFLLAAHDLPRFTKQQLEYEDSMRTAYALAHVCGRWRSIALSLPRLWTTVYIAGEYISSFPDYCEKEYNEDIKRYQAGLASHLTLSNQEPIDVFIDGRDPGWQMMPDAMEVSTHPIFGLKTMEMVMSMLLPHLLRWRALYVYTDEWPTMYVALVKLRTAMAGVGLPMLKSIDFLHLNAEPGRGRDYQPSLLDDPRFLTESAIDSTLPPELILPRLTSLKLFGVHVDWSGLQTVFSNSPTSLLELELYWIAYPMQPLLEHLSQILSACPLLERLVIHESVYENEEQAPAKAALLPRLKNFTFGFSSISVGRSVLSLIDAPNVETLSLDCIDDQLESSALLSYIGTGSLLELDEQPHHLHFHTPHTYHPEILLPQPPDITLTHRVMFPNVKHLELRSIKANSRSLQFFFASTPHLQRLKVMDGPSHAILNALLPPSPGTGNLQRTGACCCPRLQFLYTSTTDLNEAHINSLLGFSEFMSTSRPASDNGGSELKQVDFFINPGTSFTETKSALVNMGCTSVNFFVNDQDEDENGNGELNS